MVRQLGTWGKVVGVGVLSTASVTVGTTFCKIWQVLHSHLLEVRLPNPEAVLSLLE